MQHMYLLSRNRRINQTSTKGNLPVFSRTHPGEDKTSSTKRHPTHSREETCAIPLVDFQITLGNQTHLDSEDFNRRRRPCWSVQLSTKKFRAYLRGDFDTWDSKPDFRRSPAHRLSEVASNRPALSSLTAATISHFSQATPLRGAIFQQ